MLTPDEFERNACRRFQGPGYSLGPPVWIWEPGSSQWVVLIHIGWRSTRQTRDLYRLGIAVFNEDGKHLSGPNRYRPPELQAAWERAVEHSHLPALMTPDAIETVVRKRFLGSMPDYRLGGPVWVGDPARSQWQWGVDIYWEPRQNFGTSRVPSRVSGRVGYRYYLGSVRLDAEGKILSAPQPSELGLAHERAQEHCAEVRRRFDVVK